MNQVYRWRAGLPTNVLESRKDASFATFAGNTTVDDLHAHLDILAKQAHPDGGWGYGPDQPGQVEPTCLALLALNLERARFADVMKRGQDLLAQSARTDGTYRVLRGRDEAVWPTALVLFVQASLGESREQVRATVARLLGLRGSVPDEDPELVQTHDMDCRLVGWPWAEENFSWVEPTAWACLALRRAGYGDHPRVSEGLRLLLDRAFDEGGVNYGNRRVFGRATEPIPGPTALMLLALQGRGEEPRVAAAVRLLKDQAVASEDLEHLGWAKLALDCHREQPGAAEILPVLDDRIRAAYRARSTVPWVHPAPVREALVALALATTQANPFRLAAVRPAEEAAPAPAKPGRRPLAERLRSVFRGMAVTAIGHLRAPAPEAAVHIAPVTDYNADLADVLRRQYEEFRARVPLAGKRVVLKPNLVEYHRDRVINTHPHVVAAAIELCRREGAKEIIVAEGPGHWRNVEYLVSASGLGDVLRHHGVSFVDLNHDEPVKSPNLGRLTRLDFLYLARTIESAEVVISLPKLKTHHWAGATLSLKNLFGTLPGTCYGWPKNELHWRGIDNSIVDIALTRTPDLAIVDAIVGMEGDGPLNGTAKPLGALVMGADLVAVDATCCRLMQLNPERMGYLVLGQRKKLGILAEKDIRQVGEPVAALARPFDTLPHFQPLYLGRSA
jgi:uncharacterized protein (DUF362 family)